MTDPRLPATGRYYPWLDLLRFFAALSVLVFHCGDLLGLQLPSSLPRAWFQAGFLGVDLFFAISGAVIFLSVVRLAQRAEERGQTGAWRGQFLRRRMARLVPLYLLTSILFILVVNPEILQRQHLGWLLTSQLFFVSNLFSSTHGVINGPTWSLGVEMQFYLLMAIGGGWLLRQRRWTLLVLALALAGAWRWQTLHWAPATSGPGHTQYMFIHMLQLPGVIDGFMAGIVVMWWHLKADAGRIRRLFPWLAVTAFLVWWALLVLLFRHAELYWSHPAMVVGLRAAIALASGLLVAVMLSVPARFSPGPLGRWLGDTSYGVYLWHLGVILLVSRHLPQMDPLGQSALVLVLTLLLATLGWYAVERPILQWARRRN